MSPEVALSLIIACSLSKFQYNMVRKNAKNIIMIYIIHMINFLLG
jgi:hypothetical protein